MQTAQGVATGMVCYAVRIRCADIFYSKTMHQQLGKFIDAGQQSYHFREKVGVFRDPGDLLIVFPHHGHARGRGYANNFTIPKDLNKAAHKRKGLHLIAGVVVHLPAAGLAGRKLDRMSQPFQHLHHGLTRLRKQSVVIAGNE